jgi:hypothetical protein
MGREESHGVAGVEDEGLILLHDGQVVHKKPELSPVGQHLTIATIGHQLLRELYACVYECRETEGGRKGGRGRERERKENIASSQRHFQAEEAKKGINRNQSN